MSTPTLAAIRAGIAARIVAATGLDSGLVHEFERYAKTQEKLRQLYVGTGANARLHGYHVRRVTTQEIYVDVNRWRIVHEWRVRGYMAIDDEDASETLLDDEIEAIRDALRANPVIAGSGSETAECTFDEEEESGLQVIDSGPVMFAGVLAHQVVGRLRTRHFE
ncbi:MAG: hypothetical protein IT529_21835 [Burkholderiales bacterium]|nr:hypothetical protein [Burkholderiales bacterium]